MEELLADQERQGRVEREWQVELAQRARWRAEHEDDLRAATDHYKDLLGEFFVEDESVKMYGVRHGLHSTNTVVHSAQVVRLRDGKILAEFVSSMAALMKQHHTSITGPGRYEFFRETFGIGCGVFGENSLVRLSNGGILMMTNEGFFSSRTGSIRIIKTWNKKIKFKRIAIIQTVCKLADNQDARRMHTSFHLYQQTNRRRGDGDLLCDDLLHFITVFSNQFPYLVSLGLFTYTQAGIKHVFTPSEWGRLVKGTKEMRMVGAKMSAAQWAAMIPAPFENLQVYSDTTTELESFLVGTNALQISCGIQSSRGLRPLAQRKTPLPKLVYNDPADWSSTDFLVALHGVRELEVKVSFDGSNDDRWFTLWRGLGEQGNASLVKITFVVLGHNGPTMQHLTAIQECLTTNFTLDEIHMQCSDGNPMVLPEPEATFWNDEIQSQLSHAGFEERIFRVLRSVANDYERAFLVRKFLLQFQHNPTKRLSVVKLHFVSVSTAFDAQRR